MTFLLGAHQPVRSWVGVGRNVLPMNDHKEKALFILKRETNFLLSLYV
jgi:hypothetical protein